jgi:hypothetical protein
MAVAEKRKFRTAEEADAMSDDEIRELFYRNTELPDLDRRGRPGLGEPVDREQLFALVSVQEMRASLRDFYIALNDPVFVDDEDDPE